MPRSARHTFVFGGTTELNPHLEPGATHYLNKSGRRSVIRRSKLDGLVFRFMEAPEGIVITQVDEVALSRRVRVNPKRHLEGGGLGPNGRNIGEEAASSVLADVLAANRALTEKLEDKRRKLRPVARPSL